MDPELIAKAHAAIAAGADPQKVAARFRELTGGDLPSPAVAAGRIAPPGAAPEEPKQGIGSALMDYLQMISGGVLLRGNDEIAGLAAAIPGGLTPKEAVAASRRATARARERHPVGAPVAEFAAALGTGLLAPTALAGKAAAATGGLLAPAAAGALAGGAEGAVGGLLGAEGGIKERAKAAILPALFGATTGGTLPLVGSRIARRARGQGARIGRELTEETGLPSDYGALKRAAVAERRAASRSLFGPIDDIGRIDNAEITRVLTESGIPSATKPRTLKELQKVRRQLRRSNEPAADELKEVMEAQIPGYADANRAYGPAARPVEALKAGRKEYKTSEDILEAMQGMGDIESRNFAAARLHDIVARLEKRDEEAVGMLKQFIDAGPETQRQLRTLFRGDDAAFERFLGTLRRERSAEKVGHALKLGLGAGAAGGAVYYGLFR